MGQLPPDSYSSSASKNLLRKSFAIQKQKPSSHSRIEQFASEALKMQFAKILAIVSIFAGGALAAPNKPNKPPPPPSPTPVQSNVCGNGATP
ncbi:MAG: hypothetical protein LQ352_004606, partial [Teloschistes flavicans]